MSEIFELWRARRAMQPLHAARTDPSAMRCAMVCGGSLSPKKKGRKKRSELGGFAFYVARREVAPPSPFFPGHGRRKVMPFNVDE